MNIAVLQIIAGLDPADGGPPASAVATAVALRQQGLENTVAFPVERGCEDAVAGFVAVLRRHGIIIRTFPKPRMFGSFGRRWGVSPRLALWLLRNGSHFDVIHVHAGWTFTTASGLLAAKIHRRIAVLSTHESLTDFDRKKSGAVHARIKQILRWLYVGQFDAVIAASTLEQGDMGDRARLRSSVVPHAVIGESHVMRSPSIGEDVRVGFLGRLHPKKNLELLFEALALLPEQVSLYVAGDGPQAYRQTLVRHAVSCGVDRRVRWLGFVDGTRKREFLASIDLLVMPSAFECFGVAAAEALIAGLPVVVSSEVGLAEVVAEYDCGRVIAPSAEAIASAVSELMDVELRQELSANALLASTQEFSISAHGRRLKHEYEGAFSRRRRAAAL